MADRHLFLRESLDPWRIDTFLFPEDLQEDLTMDQRWPRKAEEPL